MASKLPIVKTKAVEASKFLTKHGCAYYKQMLEQNKQYIQEPPTVEKCQHLAKQVFYTRLARFVIHHFHPFNVQILKSFEVISDDCFNLPVHKLEVFNW